MKTIVSLVALLLATTVSQAQLSVIVSPVKITGQKTIVPLALKNNFSEKIESARAVVFVFDEQGRTVAQDSRWVIGGSQDKLSLAAGATNAFQFVVTGDKPFASTNLTTKVLFNRVVLEGGKTADVRKDVQVQSANK